MYATVDDYIRQFSEGESAELSDMDYALPTADRSRIAATIPLAISEVNTFLGRFKHPINNCPYLNWATLAITRMMLHSVDASEKIVQDYENVIERLESIQSGKSTLSDATGLPIDTVDSAKPNQTYYSGSMYTGHRKGGLQPRYNSALGGFVYETKSSDRRC